jgi:hypothetical protein
MFRGEDKCVALIATLIESASATFFSSKDAAHLCPRANCCMFQRALSMKSAMPSQTGDAATLLCRGCWTMDLKTKGVSAAKHCPDLYDSDACILHGPGFNKKVFWFEFVPQWRAANASELY